MSETPRLMNTHTVRRLAEAVLFHIDALSVIPMYPENDDARAMHKRLLDAVLIEMKEAIDGE